MLSFNDFLNKTSNKDEENPIIESLGTSPKEWEMHQNSIYRFTIDDTVYFKMAKNK